MWKSNVLEKICTLLPLLTFAKDFQSPGNWPKSSFKCTGRRCPRVSCDRVLQGNFLQEIRDPKWQKSEESRYTTASWKWRHCILVSKIQYTLPFTCNLIQCLGQLQLLYFTLRIWTWENLDMVGPRLYNCMMHTCKCIFIHNMFLYVSEFIY